MTSLSNDTPLSTAPSGDEPEAIIAARKLIAQVKGLINPDIYEAYSGLVDVVADLVRENKECEQLCVVLQKALDTATRRAEGLEQELNLARVVVQAADNYLRDNALDGKPSVHALRSTIKMYDRHMSSLSRQERA